MNDRKKPGGPEKWMLAVLAPLMVVCCLGPILALTFSSAILAWIKGVSGWNLAIVALLAFAGARAFFQFCNSRGNKASDEAVDGEAVDDRP